MRWDIDRISGFLNFFSSPYVTRFLKSRDSKQKQKVLFASPKFHVHQVEVESFLPFSLNFIPSCSLPPHCSGWFNGYFMVRAAHALLASLSDAPSILLGSITEAECRAFSPVFTSAPRDRFEQRRIGGWPQGRETCEFIYQYNQSQSPLCACQLSRVEIVIQCGSVCSFTQ